MTEERTLRKVRVGMVVSDKMNKTVVESNIQCIASPINKIRRDKCNGYYPRENCFVVKINFSKSK